MAKNENTITVLVAEDESPLRTLIQQCLSQRAFQVLGASDGIDALQIAKAFSSPIDILLTDIEVPGMQGWELAHEMQRVHPEAAVLFMSGSLACVPKEPHVEFLEKPFSLNALLSAIERLLAGKRILQEGVVRSAPASVGAPTTKYRSAAWNVKTERSA